LTSYNFQTISSLLLKKLHYFDKLSYSHTLTLLPASYYKAIVLVPDMWRKKNLSVRN